MKIQIHFVHFGILAGIIFVPDMYIGLIHVVAWIANVPMILCSLLLAAIMLINSGNSITLQKSPTVKSRMIGLGWFVVTILLGYYYGKLGWDILAVTHVTSYFLLVISHHILVSRGKNTVSENKEVVE